MLIFTMLAPAIDEEALGLLPSFLDPLDERPAAEQFNDNYRHGGGWKPMNGFKMGPVGEIKYAGDPPLFAIAIAPLRHEIIRIYSYGWVSITQPDGSFEVARMD